MPIGGNIFTEAMDSNQTRWRIGSVGSPNAPRTVIETGDRLYDLNALIAARKIKVPQGARTVLAILDRWDTWRPVLDRAVDARSDVVSLNLPQISWLPPVVFPRKLICVGTNYADHVEEVGLDASVKRPNPFTLMKPPSTSLIGAGQPIPLPDKAQWVDWEGEMGLVIGRRVRGATGQAALDAVAGYCIINDISARDWINDPVPGIGMDWTLHKGFDGFTPAGPLMTPAAFVDNPGRLTIRLTVNGAVKQNSSTAKMIFGVQEILEHLTSIMTLEPGDMISTGSPAGVGWAREPKEKLRDGDEVRIVIEELGELWSPVRRVTSADLLT